MHANPEGGSGPPSVRHPALSSQAGPREQQGLGRSLPASREAQLGSIWRPEPIPVLSAPCWRRSPGVQFWFFPFILSIFYPVFSLYLAKWDSCCCPMVPPTGGRDSSDEASFLPSFLLDRVLLCIQAVLELAL